MFAAWAVMPVQTHVDNNNDNDNDNDNTTTTTTTSTSTSDSWRIDSLFYHRLPSAPT